MALDIFSSYFIGTATAFFGVVLAVIGFHSITGVAGFLTETGLQSSVPWFQSAYVSGVTFLVAGISAHTVHDFAARKGLAWSWPLVATSIVCAITWSAYGALITNDSLLVLTGTLVVTAFLRLRDRKIQKMVAPGSTGAHLLQAHWGRP
jgi:hypothetical protein